MALLVSNQYFRWFDNRLAESITKSGQLSIRWMERKMNDYLNAMLKTDEDYVIAIDTDSMYIRFGPMLNRLRADKSVRSNVEYLDRVCRDIVEPFIDRGYQQLAHYTNAYQQKMQMKREAIANKGIWTGKKHYILNVYDLEGVRYDKPKLKIQGIEAVRSSTPAACRQNIKTALDIIMNQTEKELHRFIKDARLMFNTLPYEDVAFPRSVRGLLKQDIFSGGNLIQKSYYTGDATFMKSTPIHVKGALLYNRLIEKKGLTNKYPLIGEGEKIKFCYVLESAPIPTNVIAAPGKLPKELGLDSYIDYTMQFDKSFVEPLRTILDVIGWKDGSQQQLTIDSFFE